MGEVTTSEKYDPYSSDLDQVLDVLNEGRFEQARERIHDIMGKWLLNPRIHLMASAAARGLGDEKTAEMEGFFAVRCLQGMLATGDGTHERPYLVSSVHDEYDVLGHQKKSLRGQSLIEDGERMLDVLDCEDGSKISFDITRPYSAAARKLDGR